MARHKRAWKKITASFDGVAEHYKNGCHVVLICHVTQMAAVEAQSRFRSSQICVGNLRAVVLSH